MSLKKGVSLKKEMQNGLIKEMINVPLNEQINVPKKKILNANKRDTDCKFDSWLALYLCHYRYFGRTRPMTWREKNLQLIYR